MNTSEMRQILDFFISSSIGIIEEMTELQAKRGKEQIRPGSVVSSGVVTIIGITGRHKGRLMLNLPEQMAKIIAEKINGEELQGDDVEETILLSISELANIISGKAITLINNQFKDYNLRLAPPGIFYGEGIEIANPGFKTISIMINTEEGYLDVDIGFEGIEAQ